MTNGKTDSGLTMPRANQPPMTHKNNSGKPAAIVRGRHSGYLATGRASNGIMRAGPNPMTYLQ